MVSLRRSRRQEAEETTALVGQVRELAYPLHGPKDLDPLLDRIGEAHFVLLGEASHGTADYYTWRAEITKRLIQENGFSFLAVEGDWPDCYEVNRFIKGQRSGSSRDTLHAFRRWPTWMWANEEIADLADWLRQHNERLPEGRKVGFYGLDVYSLWDSLYQVMGYLRRVDPKALDAARRAFHCFEPYGEDVQEYARATLLVPESCQDDVVALLAQVRSKAAEYRAKGREDYFEVEQNALALKGAEAYYRAMVHGGPESWNLRDRHMADTLDRLMQHHGEGAKCIVWEHNTHIGDARFTDMADDGMFNVGQLARARHSVEGVVLVGFGCHRGSVIAGRAWEAPQERMRVPAGRKGSWEDVLHQASPDDKLLIFHRVNVTSEMLETRGHRAIGVVYHPEYEHLGNYVPTILPRRYDAFLFFDEAHALHPLAMQPIEEHELPETYPSGV
jgi:erythromycin esterase